MLGELLGENRGKRIVRRVLGLNPVTIEVSFEETGKILGHATTGFGTYTSVIRPDGTVFGEGQGGFSTADGEMVGWKGAGQGKLLPGGAVSYRGDVVFPNDVDEAGPAGCRTWRVRIRSRRGRQNAHENLGMEVEASREWS